MTIEEVISPAAGKRDLLSGPQMEQIDSKYNSNNSNFRTNFLQVSLLNSLRQKFTCEFAWLWGVLELPCVAESVLLYGGGRKHAQLGRCCCYVPWLKGWVGKPAEGTVRKALGISWSADAYT